jgi:hypothetical protein
MEVVVHVIDMIMKALEIRISYYESSTAMHSVGGMRPTHNAPDHRTDEPRRNVAYDGGYAIVHVVGQFLKKVDHVLRKWLGKKYGEWETLPGSRPMPQNVVL